jgi:DNA polymerase
MTSHPSPLAAELAPELAAAFAWWEAAGIDCNFTDDVTDWLAVSTAPAARSGPDPSAKSRSGNAAKAHDTPAYLRKTETPEDDIRLDLLGDSAPSDLAAFHQWWLEAPGLDAIGPRGRVPLHGQAGAELMVLVIDPEEGDRDRLLAGPQGRLLARIIPAMGLRQEDVYLASALPRHTPMADTAALAAGGMDEVLAHHIKLACPNRVLAFGTNILPLLRHELTKDLPSLREINQGPRFIPLLVSEGLDSLMAMPRLKARFWRRWIEWSADQ